GHRRAADLRDNWRRRARASVAVPLWPGTRPRRRVGRRGAARGRKRAAEPPCVVRHVPATRRANRLLLLGQRLPAAVGAADQRSVLRLWLAHSVSRQRGAGTGRPLFGAGGFWNA